VKRPRVLQIITRLGIGGAARHVIEVSSRLLGEFDILLASGPEEEREGSLREEALALGIPFAPLPSLKLRASILTDRRALREIGETIRSFNPALIHTHQSKAGILGRMAAARAGVRRSVHTFHSPLERLGRDGLLRKANTAAERRLARATGRLVAVSESLKEELIRDAIVPTDRVEVILPVVEPSRYFEERPPGSMRRRLGLPTDAPLVGFVGRLAPPKDPELFLRVFSIIAASLPDARAVVAGDGPLRPAMERHAQKLGIHSKLVFTGWLDDVREIFPDIDLLLLTSSYEGFAFAAFEAMAAGRAVVATKVTGIVDLIDHGRSGLLAPAGDAGSLAGAAILLLGDAAYRARLGATAREEAYRRCAGADAPPRVAAVYNRMLRAQTRQAVEAGSAQAVPR
jgi:glycosyltransferase involved in cell wall biosynthesis